LAAAIAVAYGGSTWYAGSQIKSRYDAALDELPKQTALVRITDRQYERGFFGAVSTVTLEIGCAPDATAAATPTPPAKPAEGEDAEADEEAEAEAEADATPPKPLRFTIRDTIHHGPLAGGSLAAATIDSELVLDAKTQADVKKLFGEAKPLSAHTKVGFGGDFTTDMTVAPAKFAEAGKGQFAWQGVQMRMDVNAARTQVRYDLVMPGMDFSDARTGTTMKMGKLTAKADMDSSAGWFLATGKTEGRLDTLELVVKKAGGEPGAAAVPADTPPKVVTTVLLQGLDLLGEATIKDGLYASSGTVKGNGTIGATKIDKFELTSSALDADEHHLAHARLALGPGRAQVAAHQLVHALEDHLALGALHVQHALVAQHLRAVDVDHRAQEVLQLGRVERPLGLEDEALDVVVGVVVVPVALVRVRGVVAMLAMLVVVRMVVGVVVAVFLQEVGVDVQLGVQVEAAQVEHLGQRHVAEVHRLLRRARVHVLQAMHQGVGLLLGHQVGLADEDLVGKAHLAPRLLPLVELLPAACLASTSVRMESSR
jgi:hypothetical protein